MQEILTSVPHATPIPVPACKPAHRAFHGPRAGVGLSAAGAAAARTHAAVAGSDVACDPLNSRPARASCRPVARCRSNDGASPPHSRLAHGVRFDRQVLAARATTMCDAAQLCGGRAEQSSIALGLTARAAMRTATCLQSVNVDGNALQCAVCIAAAAAAQMGSCRQQYKYCSVPGRPSALCGHRRLRCLDSAQADVNPRLARLPKSGPSAPLHPSRP